MKKIIMPKLSPIIPETKGKNIFVRMWVWLTIPTMWIFGEDWFFILPDGRVIIIPAGFVSDGASIPRIFWCLIRPAGILFIPSLIHDFGYRYDYLWHVSENGIMKYKYAAGQKFWDKLFFNVAIDINSMVGVDKIAYAALCCFGRKSWKKNQDNKPEVLYPDILLERKTNKCFI